jgi:crotonobetainyl-CoA:carnitine CoA-transferase CaiB-like acyl-CoA transferase
MMKPLSGITVISDGARDCCSFCSRQLADLGARVIKIERPEVGILQEITINGS